jgi:hypothetical protein
VEKKKDSKKMLAAENGLGTRGGTTSVYNISGNATITNNMESTGYVKTLMENAATTAGGKLSVRDYSGNLVILEEGKMYTSRAPNGAKVDYMLKQERIHLEYISSNKEFTAYYVLDRDCNVIDSRFPYKLDEYSVRIPRDLELRRSATTLSNGYRMVDVQLKWGRSINLLYDQNGKLQQLSAKGGWTVSHEGRIIEPNQ